MRRETTDMDSDEAARRVDSLARVLDIEWQPEERAAAVTEAQALAQLIDRVWSYPLPAAVSGWRPVGTWAATSRASERGM